MRKLTEMTRLATRLTAMLLAGMMVFGAAPGAVFAAGPAGARGLVRQDSSMTVIRSGACGDNLTWTLDEEGTLTISGTGDMTDSPWNEGSQNDDITQVVIESGVTSIDDYAFCACTGLTGVTIPEGVTRIGKSAFYSCTSLTGVAVPEGVTRIEESTFYSCTSLTSVAIPKSVTSIGSYVFSDCDSLTDVYYAGSKKDWESISTGNYNDGLTNAVLHCAIEIPDVSDASIKGLTAKTYTGKEITQKPVVTLGGTTLTANTDYKVSYSNNINAGTAKMTITGKGNYTGKKTVSFKINKADQNITAKAASSPVSAGKTTTVSVSGAKGTKSYKSSDTSIATVDKSTGKVTAKKVGTVKITAKSAATANYNAASKTVTIKVVPGATKSLTASNQKKGIKLAWKKVAGATGYIIYINGKAVKTINSGSTVSYTRTQSNTNGKKYVFKIVAKAATGNSTLSKSITYYKIARPTISSATNSESKKMTVKWGKNAKATGYKIQYSRSKKFSSGNKTIKIKNASTVSKVVGSLKKGKTYYVRVRAYKKVGDKTYNSAWSGVRTVKISK